MTDVRGPDGRIVRFPDGTDQGTIMRVMGEIYSGQQPTDGQQGLQGSVSDTKPAEGTIGSAVRAAANGITAGWADKIAAAADTVLPLDSGSQSGWVHGFSDAYAHNRQMQQAQTQADEAAHPTASLLGNVAGAIASPLNKIAAPVEGAGMLANAGRLALGGAAYGGAYGAGQSTAQDWSGEGTDALKGAAGGAMGNLIGAGVGKALGGAVNAFAPRIMTPMMDAANRLGVKLLPADVGGTGAKLASSVIRGGTIGEIPMQEAAQASLGSAAAARSGVAQSIGDVSSDATGAGQRLIAGVKSFLSRSADRASQLYEAIPIDPQSEAVTGATRDALQQVTQGLDSNPELSRLWAENPRLKATLDALTPKDVSGEGASELTAALPRLAQAKQAYTNAMNGVTGPGEQAAARAELDAAQQAVDAATQKAYSPPEGGKLSWGDMKRFRSIIGQIVGQPSLTSEGPEREALRTLYGALSNDMEATAAQNGPQSLTAFQRANQYWRGRQGRIDNVLSIILGNDGNKSAEGAFAQVNRWAQNNGGNFQALAQTMRSLPADEANSVRATILDRMGQARAGAQNADGSVFSPSEFVTQWNNLSDRAKSVLFPDAQHRADIDSLAQIMDSMKRAGAYTNHSKTGIIGGGLAAMHAVASPLTGIPQLIAEYGAGKLMGSPQLARRLASRPAAASEVAALASGKTVAGATNALSGNIRAAQVGQKLNALAPRVGNAAMGAVLGIQHATP